MTKIAIVGVGSVGGVIAGWLTHRGGYELTLCARRQPGEVSVELFSAGKIKLPATILTDPAQGRPVDWVIVTTKAYDAAGAAAWFPSLVGPRTLVAILQNGVEQRERFTPYLPGEKILPVMVDCPAERPAPGRIVQRGAGRLSVPAGPDGARFVELFSGTALEVTQVTDFKSTVWRKLCMNSAGVISALLLKPAGVMRDDNVAILARAIVRECIAVGRAEGAVLEDSLPDTVVESYRKGPPDSINSLQADRAAGRPMEIDARNGAIVRLGRKHGIPTPSNEAAAILLAAM